MTIRNPIKKLHSVLLYFLLLTSSFVFAQEAPGISEKSCLWKVQSETNVIYLLGSIHYLKAENYPLPQAIENAFEDVRILVFEMNLDSASTPKSQSFIMQKASYGNDMTLEKSLKAETYTLAGEKANEIGLPIATLNGFKPWFFSLSLIAVKLQSLGYNPNHGIDKYFFNKAKETEKQILAFETLEYQINLFDELSDDFQELIVLQTLNELDVIETEIDQLVESWKKGDVKGMEATVLKSLGEFPEIQERFINKRNKNWLPQIIEYLQAKEKTMIIVGAGHLVGKEGLVNLLQDKGYQVDQL